MLAKRLMNDFFFTLISKYRSIHNFHRCDLIFDLEVSIRRMHRICVLYNHLFFHPMPKHYPNIFVVLIFTLIMHNRFKDLRYENVGKTYKLTKLVGILL